MYRERRALWERLKRPHDVATQSFARLNKLSDMMDLRRCAEAADALLVSFPKSGRTWLRYILARYFASGLEHGAAALDLYGMFGLVPNFDFDPLRGLPAYANKVALGAAPLVLVSHEVNWLLLPRHVPIILMVRDPRDVLVSAYFHATRHKRSFSGSLDSFIEARQQGLPLMIAYLNRVSRKMRGRPCHVLSYERMSADPEKEVSALLEFIGCEIVPQHLKDAIAAGQFEQMRKLELAGGLPGHQYDRTDGESLRMRKGTVGGFKDYLNREQIARIETLCGRGLSPRAKSLLTKAGVGMVFPWPDRLETVVGIQRVAAR